MKRILLIASVLAGLTFGSASEALAYRGRFSFGWRPYSGFYLNYGRPYRGWNRPYYGYYRPYYGRYYSHYNYYYPNYGYYYWW